MLVNHLNLFPRSLLKALFHFLTGLVFISLVSAKDYFVAPTGSDEALGSIEAPFASIKKAADLMRAGDTCFIRGGAYQESVNLADKQGSRSHPITFKNYQNEHVLMNGTVQLKAKWIKDKGAVYKAQVDHNVIQLFFDNEIMTLARLPNALAFSPAVFNRHRSRLDKSVASKKDEVIAEDEGHALYRKRTLTGCIAVLNFQDHLTRAYVIQNHKAGSKTFTFSPPWNGMKTSKSYFIEGGVGKAERVLLDSAEEWAFDEKTKTLYLWPKGNKNPNNADIRSKVQVYAFTGNTKTKNIVIDGINFIATAFHFKGSDAITIKNCNLNYFSASRRSLGQISITKTAHFSGMKSDFCEDITVYNCTFKNADSSALIGDYMRNTLIDNNLFQNIDYAATTRSTINVQNSDGIIYRRNTINTAGKAQGFGTYRYREGKLNPILCEYNFHTNCGLLEKDGSSIYMANESIWESVARYNWFIDNKQRDFRWDGRNEPKLLGRDANFYRNVGVGTMPKRVAVGKGFRLKGDYHEVYNNLNLFRHSDLNVSIEKGGNAHTVTRNNAADTINPANIPGIHSHNYSGQTKRNLPMFKLLRDIKNWDFRPREGVKGLIDQGTPVKCTASGQKIDITKGFKGKAPDIGAYEHGDEFYWIPGRILKTASMPIPKHNAVSVPRDADLIYLQGLGGITSEIYFGDSADNLQPIASMPSNKNIVRPTKEPSLKGGKTYFWRVDTVLKDGSKIDGKTWSFSTN